MRRLDDAAYERALRGFAAIWAGVAQIAVGDDELIAQACQLGERLALRGYDAVHCATAAAAASADFVAVSGDRNLLRARDGLGIATVDAVR
ncbi:MAG: hypothetical protein QM626_06820 [Microbacterium sp.]|uniref:hypothetical protein n=1 Tax=Microbacterium sp. TaxID=51671 RepID=UPI0039E288C7